MYYLNLKAIFGIHIVDVRNLQLNKGKYSLFTFKDWEVIMIRVNVNTDLIK